MDYMKQYNEYKESYDNIINVLSEILESGEITSGSQEHLEEAYVDYNQSYSEAYDTLRGQKNNIINDKIEKINQTKVGADKESIINILTDNGVNNSIFLDDDNNVIINGEAVPELNQVKLVVDEQNKKIESLVSGGEIEIDGEKKTVQVAFTDLKQTVDGISTTVTDFKQTVEGNYYTKEQTTAQITTKANEINSTVANTYATKESVTNQGSQIKQNADKISMIVANDSTASKVILTNNAINAISENINLTADHIKLEGYTTINGGFKVDEQGNIEATNANIKGTIYADSGEISSNMKVSELNVEGNLSADTLTIRNLNCQNISPSLIDDVDVTVDPTNGNDLAVFSDDAVYATLQGCLEAIPKNLNGYTVNIQLLSPVSENILIRGFNGGAIYIKMNNKDINGYVKGQDCSARIFLYGGNTVSDISTGATSARPAIKPATLTTEDTYNYGVYFANCSYVMVRNIDVYGKTGSASNYAIGGAYASNIYVQNTKIVGSENGIQVRGMARCTEQNTYGKVNGKGHRAIYGGTIYINDGTMINGTIDKSNCSQVIYSTTGAVKDGTTTSTGNNDNTSTATSTITLKSNSGDTYRSTVYNNWKNDNTVRQGDYGYGDCNGCWFFGTQFAKQLQGKTIKQLTLKVTRNSGGISGSTTCTLRMHNYASKPASAPSYVSGWSQNFGATTGASTTITITDSTVLNAIKDGTCKGFGIKGTYDKTHYAVFSGSCTLTAVVE